MEYIEPRELLMTFDNNSYSGMISGNEVYVKFECQDQKFLELFPEGYFDTMHIRPGTLDRQRQDIVDWAGHLLKGMLPK